MYCTVEDVQDNTIIELARNAGWSETDIRTRIEEGEDVINGRLAKLGYTVPFSEGNVPGLIRRAAVLYARGAVIRDMRVLSADRQAEGGGFGPNGYMAGFNKIMDELEDGTSALVGNEGIIQPASTSQSQILSNGDGVRRALSMGDPESSFISDCYGGPDVTGD